MGLLGVKYITEYINKNGTLGCEIYNRVYINKNGTLGCEIYNRVNK